jgi:selenocysteine lyase/cysteine desulfurase
METGVAQSVLNQKLVEAEFPRTADAIYLNTGSNGRKPISVLHTINDAWGRLNINPTLSTFLDPEPWLKAREACARVLQVPAKSVLITQSTTQGLHLIMHSFLLKAGDELVTTNHEHGSLNTIARYLEETRGIIVRRCEVHPDAGSSAFSLGILDLITERTKLVALSEIGSYTGWRPDISSLTESLALLEVPLLVDGAHVAGQVWTEASRYPLWVGSAHKWLGAPNGTGFAYVAPNLVSRLEPVWLGDQFFNLRDNDWQDLSRFESMGTSDVVRLEALAQACELYLQLTPEAVAQRQFELVDYARRRLAQELNPTFRTPPLSDILYKTAMLTFFFSPQRLQVKDLREALWQRHKIWVQPDFINSNPATGMRISCHYSVQESDIDALILALKTVINDG